MFVAARGSDSNPCTIAAPCLTFQRAHDTVAFGGVIEALDPANYGSVTITRSISIQGHGFAEIGVDAGKTGIQVPRTAADAVVYLNGLIIDGNGHGMRGIEFNGGKSLRIENCIVRGVLNSGFTFYSNSATSVQTLFVSNSYFGDNIGDAGSGIEIISLLPSTTLATAVIERVVFYRNRAFGLVVASSGGGPISAVVTDSVAANNLTDFPNSGGFYIGSYNGGIVTLTLTRSAAVGNYLGVSADGTNGTANPTLRISQLTVIGNTIGYKNSSSGGAILSYGDNYIEDNGSNVGTLGSASKQ